MGLCSLLALTARVGRTLENKDIPLLLVNARTYVISS